MMRSREQRFDWPLCYEAEDFILELQSAFLNRNRFAQRLAQRMLKETGTLLMDWIDHLVVSSQNEYDLRHYGFLEDFPGETAPNQTAFWHPEAMLPRVVVDHSIPEGEWPSRLAVRVDRVTDFITAHHLAGEVQGGPLTRYRKVEISKENDTVLEVVERRGYRGYLPVNERADATAAVLKAHELWKTRQRVFADDGEGFAATHQLLDHIIELVGRNLACHIIFAEERAYWESRNRAAQLQKGRQDSLGLGWANHDHHTFRSSRPRFVELMLAFEKLGFERRERYYAGVQAGWGAQILEHPVEGIIAFCDVDLEPQETEIDFSRHPLGTSRRLGTVGLWAGLHGESFLEAGMHHLECRFHHNLLRQQMRAMNIGTMKSFSDFEFLKQAFTEGERWPVRRERAERLWREGLITENQFKKFVAEGAIGSHLENLQRKGGFKGFNQDSVSAIIQATDPRNIIASGA